MFVFSDTYGYAYLTESVRSEATGKQIATSGPEPAGGTTAERISKWGGPGYFWLPTEDYSGLPLASAMSRRVPASAAICRRAADNG
ncbi:MAG TPA: hypothetical protein VMR00_02680 [Streptosporangiaceae bacterium]|nr:hypothetical protein [Streptosporangiaceae bacterium]